MFGLQEGYASDQKNLSDGYIGECRKRGANGHCIKRSVEGYSSLVDQEQHKGGYNRHIGLLESLRLPGR
ncbi:hypothetical protein TNCV_4012181 [Trichonephila clavipes]|nr:hypothetical protein TNCV_4012181 [Trichonephila clavipes]